MLDVIGTVFTFVPAVFFFKKFTAVWRGAFDLRGKITRYDYWIAFVAHLNMFVLINHVGVYIYHTLHPLLPDYEVTFAVFRVTEIYLFIGIVPFCAASVRRFRDAGKIKYSRWVYISAGLSLLTVALAMVTTVIMLNRLTLILGQEVWDISIAPLAVVRLINSSLINVTAALGIAVSGGGISETGMPWLLLTWVAGIASIAAKVFVLIQLLRRSAAPTDTDTTNLTNTPSVERDEPMPIQTLEKAPYND
jgi:uncharacterized membrane protein YhaH (DUF805 family)